MLDTGTNINEIICNPGVDLQLLGHEPYLGSIRLGRLALGIAVGLALKTILVVLAVEIAVLTWIHLETSMILV